LRGNTNVTASGSYDATAASRDSSRFFHEIAAVELCLPDQRPPPASGRHENVHAAVGDSRALGLGLLSRHEARYKLFESLVTKVQ